MVKKKIMKKVSKRKVIKKLKSKPKIEKFSRWRAVPLKGTFMVIAILGFLLSYYYIYSISTNFGIACMVIFGIMFIASLVSMTKAPLGNKNEKK